MADAAAVAEGEAPLTDQAPGEAMAAADGSSDVRESDGETGIAGVGFSRKGDKTPLFLCNTKKIFLIVSLEK